MFIILTFKVTLCTDSYHDNENNTMVAACRLTYLITTTTINLTSCLEQNTDDIDVTKKSGMVKSSSSRLTPASATTTQ